MVTTRSKRKAATPVSAGPSSPTTPIRPESPLQTPESPARPLKRKRNRNFDDSPVPLKLRKESTAPSETSRPRIPIQLPSLVSESDPDSHRPRSSARSDAAVVETNGPKNEQDPIYVPKLFKQDVATRDWSDVGQHTNLEYFQAFPHDPRSTLCVEHFLSLTEKWYWKRKPTVHAQLIPILRDTTTRPDFSNLALPVCEET
ncbi:hypothetical protein FSPOR_8834 [Fusarium sporotrichioides]|uniref:Uncharacterized protein n=1 Tax=Fusarium sporotrichioides TaxID=5514 RepID=A0A395RSN4_FUSSP|nr:hypothetical protein FSPOR_8834 [Fusarium sporotrichioides]